MKSRCQVNLMDEYYQDIKTCQDIEAEEMQDEIRFLKAALKEANSDADFWCQMYNKLFNELTR